MNKQIKNVVMGVAVVAGMMVGVAQAADAPAQAVRYQDLNMNTDAGVQALYHRIQGAANQVCGTVDGRDLALAKAHKACVDKAVADAVAAVNMKTVTVAQVR